MSAKELARQWTERGFHQDSIGAWVKKQTTATADNEVITKDEAPKDTWIQKETTAENKTVTKDEDLKEMDSRKQTIDKRVNKKKKNKNKKTTYW